MTIDRPRAFAARISSTAGAEGEQVTCLDRQFLLDRGGDLVGAAVHQQAAIDIL
ncbi:MAG: hypothetical protein PGN08_15830 [Sphingomonas taxi]